MRGAIPGLSLALLAAERGARLCAIIHYLVHGQLGWFGLTTACVVPGYAAQLLSILWFRADGHPPSCWLLVLHLLQLGLWKRYWDVLRIAGGSARAGEVLTQLGDVCVLQLLEALLQTLPHLLLQAYVVVAVDPVGFIPGVSAGLSLLSLSWALASYSHFTCLLKPGHLSLPAGAMLCLMLWRTGMLGTRVLALVLFARLYSFWVFAVAGVHWLLMSFWLVAQQTDIVAQPCRWRLFNGLLGAVYIFCYINVRPGPSKTRVSVFYAIMLMENTLLLLLATRFLQAELRNSLGVTGAVMSGSVIGATALVVYYSLLHPKSTEIWQGFLETSCSAAAAGDDEVSGESSQAGQSSGISGDEESLSGEGTTADPKNGNSSLLLQSRGCLEDSWTNHHHWLLVKLALKTGDLSVINAAFGDGGVGEVYPGGWMMGKPTGVESGANFSPPMRDIVPQEAESGLTVGNGGSIKPSASAAGMAQEDGAGQEPVFPPSISRPSSFSPDSAEGSSVYFTAVAGGITLPGTGTGTGTTMCMPLVQKDSEAQPSPGCLREGRGAVGRGGGEDLSLGMASISPILGTCAHKHLQRSFSLGNTGSCGVAGPPNEGSEGTEGALTGWNHLWDTHPCGTQGTVRRSKLRSPCFTSTPKADPKCPQQGLGELGEGTDLSGLPG
ncbi:XK-related protein 5-like [Neopelma chrysocephalum]|uniref:XK-related protein 5-like n=1 Tax=Neopelma chrysocephalum TaxID=114329 RepID=UPI000FCCEB90|nr:XK-related protein 5-like [Neopelma chrysocephalum]